MKVSITLINPDIVETRLIRASGLEKKLNFSKIYLKLEQDNPTHTHKDRAAELIVNEAKKIGSNGVTIGTCGNFGVSISYFCHLLGLNSHLFIPKSYEIPRLNEMITYGANISYTKGTYEDAVDKSAEFSKVSGFFDANPHGIGAKLAITGYKKIAKEIYDCLGYTPSTVWVSVGNGTLLVGVYSGFLELGNNFRLGAVSSKKNNAITESYIQGKRIKLKSTDLNETSINETLLNWRPTQLEESLSALKNSNGFAYGATDEELIEARSILEKYEGISTTPASASALAGFIKNKNILSKKDSHVIVLTN